MVKLNRGPAVSGPSSSLGLMRFFDADTAGPKLTPEFIVGVAVVVLIVLVVAKMMFGL